jgi:hypothetical protein
MPTKPLVATVSPSWISRTASSARERLVARRRVRRVGNVKLHGIGNEWQHGCDARTVPRGAADG